MDWEIRFHGKYRQDLMIRPRFCHRVKTTGGKWVFPPPLSIYLTAWSGVGLVIWFDCLHPRLISMFFFWDVREKCVIEEDAWGYFWAANWLVHKTWRFNVFREYKGQIEFWKVGCGKLSTTLSLGFYEISNRLVPRHFGSYYVVGLLWAKLNFF